MVIETRAPDGFAELMSRRHLPALDGLRAVAVALVMLYHYTEARLIPGDLGVSLFFVLSGFLITLLLLREDARVGSISISGFYARRTLRIFPAYYVYIAFSLCIDTVRRHPWSPGLLAAALAYLMNYYNALNGHPVTSVAHAWSLADEEQFYLLWPAAFLLLRKASRRAAISWIGGFTALVLAWRTYLFLSRGVGPAYVYNAFDTRCDALAVGCLLAFASSGEWFAAAAARISSRPWLPLMTIALIYGSRVFAPPLYHYSLGFTVDAILLAVLIVQVMQLSASPLWSWLDNKVVRYIGAISYPLYLYHGWGLAVASHIVHGVALTVLLAAAVSVGLASGSYYVVERPFLRLKRRIESARLNPREAAAVPL